MDCPKCKTKNAIFGVNKSRPNGFSAYCKSCMRESRKNANNKPIDWKEVNKSRRERPGYRERERIRSNELDKTRRQVDKAYSKKRYAQEKKNREEKPEVLDKIKSQRRDRYKTKYENQPKPPSVPYKERKARTIRKLVNVINEVTPVILEKIRRTGQRVRAMEDDKTELLHMEDRKISAVLHDLKQLDRSLKHYFNGRISPLPMRSAFENLDYRIRLYLEEVKAKIKNEPIKIPKQLEARSDIDTCPFCGSFNVELYTSQVDGYFSVLCGGCGAQSGKHWQEDKKRMVIDGWNRRV